MFLKEQAERVCRPEGRRHLHVNTQIAAPELNAQNKTSNEI